MNQNYKEGKEVFFALKPENLAPYEKKVKFRQYFKLRINLKLRENEMSKKDNIFVTMEKGRAIFQHPYLYFSHIIKAKNQCSYFLTLQQMNDKKKFIQKGSIQIPYQQYLEKKLTKQNQGYQVCDINHHFIFSYKLYVGTSKQQLQKILNSGQNIKQLSSKKISRSPLSNHETKNIISPLRFKDKTCFENILSCQTSEYNKYCIQINEQNTKNPQVIVFRPTNSIFFDEKGRKVKVYDSLQNKIKNPLLNSTLNANLAQFLTQQLVKKVFSPAKGLHLPIPRTLLQKNKVFC